MMTPALSSAMPRPTASAIRNPASSRNLGPTIAQG
jgi:hypothetical protein